MGLRSALHVVQEVMSIGKELWKPMTRLCCGLQSRHKGNGSARCRNAEDRRLVTIRSKDDCAFAVPGASTAFGRVGKNLHGSTININPLQSSFREKPKRLA